MIYNAQYYPTSSSCVPITIKLNQKQIIINANSPNKFQKKIFYDNCFGLTYSKDEKRYKKVKEVEKYIPFLIKTPTPSEIENLDKSNDVNMTYTTLTLHTLDIPERDRMSSTNEYLEYTVSFETSKDTYNFFEALKEKINIKENRHLLCILNPMSGSKKSLYVYNNLVIPMFKIANITTELKETKYQCHCEEIAYSLDLNKYDGIVSVSGDGLFHELLNGLLSRNDWEKARYMPIGMINGGTSNALNINLSGKGTDFDVKFKNDDIIYMWDSVGSISDVGYIKVGIERIKEFNEKLEGNGGTESFLIAEIAKQEPEYRDHLLIVTDGEVDFDCIQKAQEILENTRIEFKYVTLFVIGNGDNLSVGAPFCRNCENIIFGIILLD